MNWLIVWLVGNTQLAIALALAASILTRLPSYQRATKTPAIDSNHGFLFGRRHAMRWNSIAHLLWVFVLIKLLCPPLTWWTAQVSMSHVSINRVQVNQRTASPHLETPSLAPASTAFNPTTHQSPTEIRHHIAPIARLDNAPIPSVEFLSITFATVWLIGSIMTLYWTLISARRISRMIENRGRFSREANEQLRRIASTTRTTTNPPDVWLIDAVASPMLYSPLWKFRRRSDLILFPRSLWQSLDEDSRGVLLRHELAHWQRRDNLVRKVEMVATVILWWHPLVWVAKRQIENCEERCCDAIATSNQPELRRTYAEAILKTLDFLCDQVKNPTHQQRGLLRSRPFATGVGRLPRIEKRLRQIMHPIDSANESTFHSRENASIWQRRWWCLPLIIILLPVSPMITLQRMATVPHRSSLPQSGDKPILTVQSEVEITRSARSRKSGR